MAKESEIYRKRFGGDEEFRKKMYQVLCKDFFQKYISEESSVLDIAAGYCEFINNIKAKKKVALDINPDVKKHASSEVQTIVSRSTDIPLDDDSVDIVYVSNFFEHISREEIVLTLKEIRRVLKRTGRLLILQPNIRFCARDYWMFFDHITPIDDRSLTEVLELTGFEVIEMKERFLPYTTKGNLPKSLLLLRLYLMLTPIHRLLGGQAFAVARKSF